MHTSVRSVGFTVPRKLAYNVMHWCLVPVIHDACQAEDTDTQDKLKLEVAKPMESLSVYSTISEAIQCLWELEWEVVPPFIEIK